MRYFVVEFHSKVATLNRNSCQNRKRCAKTEREERRDGYNTQHLGTIASQIKAGVDVLGLAREALDRKAAEAVEGDEGVGTRGDEPTINWQRLKSLV